MNHKPTRYLIALGSNRARRGRQPPSALLQAAMAALDIAPLKLLARSPIIQTLPLGPGGRRYANAAAIVETRMLPPDLLAHLHAIERRHDRRRHRRWGHRTLDLDLILWSEGAWATAGLTIPHTAFRERSFVLTPASTIAAKWRDPLTHLTVAHLQARLAKTRPKPVDPAPPYL